MTTHRFAQIARCTAATAALAALMAGCGIPMHHIGAPPPAPTPLHGVNHHTTR